VVSKGTEGFLSALRKIAFYGTSVYDPVFILLLHAGMVYLDIRLRLLYLFYFEHQLSLDLY